MVLSACLVAARLYLFQPDEKFCQESSNCCNRVLAVSKTSWEGAGMMRRRRQHIAPCFSIHATHTRARDEKSFYIYAVIHAENHVWRERSIGHQSTLEWKMKLGTLRQKLWITECLAFCLFCVFPDSTVHKCFFGVFLIRRYTKVLQCLPMIHIESHTSVGKVHCAALRLCMNGSGRVMLITSSDTLFYTCMSL